MRFALVEAVPRVQRTSMEHVRASAIVEIENDTRRNHRTHIIQGSHGTLGILVLYVLEWSSINRTPMVGMFSRFRRLLAFEL